MHDAHELASLWPSLDVAHKQSRLRSSIRFYLGSSGIDDSDRRLADEALIALWRRDSSAWSQDAATRQRIDNRLGWLSSPALMADEITALRAFGAAVKQDGLEHVVLLGMGGSSLAPEVLRAVLGVAPGFPAFRMVDSTDPGSVRAAETPPERTLYVLASKSGTTIEPNSLAAYFRSRLESRVPSWADHFVAITDEGTELAQRARRDGFRRVFINPSDIGGRYSAVSYFGLVPAALMGQDLNALVGWSLAMLALSEPAGLAPGGMTLGLAIGAAARSGRDKLTLLLPPSIEPFGLWVEQLIAESTGKNGVGVVPVVGEATGPASSYGRDRLFVRARIGAQPDGFDHLVRELQTAGAPVVEIEMPEPTALGAEFVRWEIATAVAGAVLRVNPFDEPNVQQAKDATSALLGQFKTTGRLPGDPREIRLQNGVALSLTEQARNGLGGRSPESILTLVRAADYVGVLAYVNPEGGFEEELKAFRRAVRDRTGAATTLGYGPRYLHSTGQLHKGGSNTGLFVLITADPREDVPIPGQPFTFGTLELAQGLGDFTSLDRAGRRALHVHLPQPDPGLLREVAERLLRG